MFYMHFPTDRKAQTLAFGYTNHGPLVGMGGGEFNQRMGPLLRFDLATQATSGSITIKASNKGELCNH